MLIDSSVQAKRRHCKVSRAAIWSSRIKSQHKLLRTADVLSQPIVAQLFLRNISFRYFPIYFLAMKYAGTIKSGTITGLEATGLEATGLEVRRSTKGKGFRPPEADGY